MKKLLPIIILAGCSLQCPQWSREYDSRILPNGQCPIECPDKNAQILQEYAIVFKWNDFFERMQRICLTSNGFEKDKECHSWAYDRTSKMEALLLSKGYNKLGTSLMYSGMKGLEAGMYNLSGSDAPKDASEFPTCEELKKVLK